MSEGRDQAQASTPQRQPAETSDRPEAWRVEPARDGRGEQRAKPPMIPRSRALLAFFAGLLVINLVISFLTGAPPDRPRVPYQPFFLEEVEAGNVEAITSREDAIEGELTEPRTYDPPGDNKPFEVDRFMTQVPAFIDRTDLTTLLTDKEVVINARAPDAGRSFLLSLLLGLAPALLLVGFFVWLSRRQGRGGVLGGFGRSTARRLERGGHQRVCRRGVGRSHSQGFFACGDPAQRSRSRGRVVARPARR